MKYISAILILFSFLIMTIVTAAQSVHSFEIISWSGKDTNSIRSWNKRIETITEETRLYDELKKDRAYNRQLLRIYHRQNGKYAGIITVPPVKQPAIVFNAKTVTTAIKGGDAVLMTRKAIVQAYYAKPIFLLDSLSVDLNLESEGYNNAYYFLDKNCPIESMSRVVDEGIEAARITFYATVNLSAFSCKLYLRNRSMPSVAIAEPSFFIPGTKDILDLKLLWQFFRDKKEELESAPESCLQSFIEFQYGRVINPQATFERIAAFNPSPL